MSDVKETCDDGELTHVMKRLLGTAVVENGFRYLCWAFSLSSVGVERSRTDTQDHMDTYNSVCRWERRNWA